MLVCQGRHPPPQPYFRHFPAYHAIFCRKNLQAGAAQACAMLRASQVPHTGRAGITGTRAHGAP